jgi:SAM-dependent methyltransferase
MSYDTRNANRTRVEICGDGRMSLGDRLRYMAQNFVRNFNFRQSTVASKKIFMPRQSRTSGLASPSRALTEAFLCRQLPDLLPAGEIRVLDIGCGAGGLVRLLAELGYRGSYIGIDIQDAFDRNEEPGFKKEFLVVDAHQYQPEEKFDLVVSVSALEHIPDDSRLISRLADFLTARGLQLHFVPSQWALPVYLWHGYRQYTLASLEERFGADRVAIFRLGGGTSFFLHFLFITGWEILFRVNLRKHFSRLYTHLLDASLAVDRYLPALSTFYAVVSRATPPTRER